MILIRSSILCLVAISFVLSSEAFAKKYTKQELKGMSRGDFQKRYVENEAAAALIPVNRDQTEYADAVANRALFTQVMLERGLIDDGNGKLVERQSERTDSGKSESSQTHKVSGRKGNAGHPKEGYGSESDSDDE